MDSFTPKVIEAVKKYPIIYTRGAGIHSADLLQSAWNKTEKELGVDFKLIRDRWKNLKDTYVRYRRIEGLNMKWRWGKHMSFLESADKPTDDETQNITAEDKLDESHEINNDVKEEFRLIDTDVSNDYEFVFEDTVEATEEIQEPIRKKTKKRKPSVEQPIDPLIFDNNLTNVQCDRLDLLFLGYANSLKRLSHIKQVIVKYKISKILMEAEMSEIQQ